MMKASTKKIAGFILMLLFFSSSAIAQNLYSTWDTAAFKLKGSFKAVPTNLKMLILLLYRKLRSEHNDPVTKRKFPVVNSAATQANNELPFDVNITGLLFHNS